MSVCKKVSLTLLCLVLLICVFAACDSNGGYTTGNTSAETSEETSEKTSEETQTDHVHRWSQWYTSIDPTCTANGVKKRTCSGCDNYEIKIIDALGHGYYSNVTIEPTCTEQGYIIYECYCGDSYSEVYAEATGHKFGEWSTNQEPTCTTLGSEIRFCIYCSDYETQEIPAKGHSYDAVRTDPTCTEQGYTTYTCSCGSYYKDLVTEATGHTYKPPVVTPPTCIQQGYTTHTCHCGHSYKDTYVDALGHNFENNNCTRCNKHISQGLKFISNGDSTCYVAGMGTCTDTEIIIPAVSPAGYVVTGIGKYAFEECADLTSITIPDSVISIGYMAFLNCTSLTRVTIGNSVENIGDAAFASCDKLVEVCNLSSLNIIKGDKSNGYVGYYALSVYRHLESKLWTTTDGFIFYEDGDACYLVEYTGNQTDITLPADCHGKKYAIYQHAFDDCAGLTSITIPDGVTSIGRYAFYGCTELTSITIPDSVTSIGAYAFYDCISLTKVIIGNGLTSIGQQAFDGCYKLLEIYNLSSLNITKGSDDYGYVGYYALDIYHDLTETSKLWTTTDGFIFYEDGDACYLVEYTGNQTDITLPADCHGKKYAINQYTFYYSSLTSVTIPNSVTSIGQDAFCHCTELTSITIPDSVTSIGAFAFASCMRLTSITIGDGVTSIEDRAFINCSELKSIIIPYSVKSIGWNVFSGCSSIVSIAVDSQNTNYTSINGHLYTKDGKMLIQYAIGRRDRDFTIPNSVTIIGEYAFSDCKYLTSITIPDSVTSIGNEAFCGCTGLTSVTIPNSVTIIGEYAFSGCKYLTSITIPDSVTSIGNEAFYGCTGLTSVTIGNGVTSIGRSAFEGCTGLTSIMFDGTMEQWNAISKAYNWNHDCSVIKVICSDGYIEIRHEYTSIITEPTCTERGYTTRTCECGHSIVDTFIDALGHNYVNGVCTVCDEKDPNYVPPATTGGSADFDSIVTSYPSGGDSSYTKTFTTANGWTVENSAIQCGGSQNVNPQYTVIGPDNTHKAVCLNGRVGFAGKITSPTLSGGISKLTINYTKMFSDTNLSVTVTVIELSSGKTYTHVVSAEIAENERYVVYTDEWTLDTPITGDFVIDIVNDCPSGTNLHKDRFTILDLTWEGAASAPATPAPETFTFADYVVSGELGGAAAVRNLGDNLTLTISAGWINSDTARIYKNENAVIKSNAAISSMTINAGYKDSTFNVYVSEDGETWALLGNYSYTTAYSDITITFETATKYVKIDAPNQQVRMKTLSVVYA